MVWTSLSEYITQTQHHLSFLTAWLYWLAIIKSKLAFRATLQVYTEILNIKLNLLLLTLN